MDRETLRRYARLIARSGVNIQQGQYTVIRTAPEQLDCVEMLAEECYLAGAAKVLIEWRYQPFTRLDIQYQSDEVLGRVESWEEENMKKKTELLPANIYLCSEDPDGLAGIDQDKWARAQQARYQITRPYSDAMENKYQWCVAAVAGAKWAKKVFPELDEAEAVEKLWQSILSCARAGGEDPIGDWEEHSGNLRRRCQWLNSLELRRLIYKSESTGTDFSVGLMPQMLFCGGAEKLPDKEVWYNANIPSEEVFTTPKSGDAEGVVYSTMPLSYRGVLIENFSLRFEKGRVVEAHAEKNEEALKLMLAMDEGASMLGECALVPYKSPIRESGILFYNTLFDENASCHLAFGEAYPECIEGGAQMERAQLQEKGLNYSITHVDFMVGTADLSIVGTLYDGREVPVFVNGNFVI